MNCFEIIYKKAVQTKIYTAFAFYETDYYIIPPMPPIPGFIAGA